MCVELSGKKELQAPKVKRYATVFRDNVSPYLAHLLALTPSNSPQFNGCAERGCAMLESMYPVARLQSKSIFCNHILPENRDGL